MPYALDKCVKRGRVGGYDESGEDCRAGRKSKADEGEGRPTGQRKAAYPEGRGKSAKSHRYPLENHLRGGGDEGGINGTIIATHIRERPRMDGEPSNEPAEAEGGRAPKTHERNGSIHGPTA